jgi:hypothetical protein
MENYKDLLKSELVALCEERGLSSEGLKAELIEKLIEDDQKKKPLQEVKAKKLKKVWNSQLFRYEYK